MDLTDTQKQNMALYMTSNQPRTKHDIAEDLGLSKSYVSKPLSEIRDELDFEVTELDNAGTRTYKLKPHEKQRLQPK